MALSDFIRWDRLDGKPITIADGTITPQSRALIVSFLTSPSFGTALSPSRSIGTAMINASLLPTSRVELKLALD